MAKPKMISDTFLPWPAIAIEGLANLTGDLFMASKYGAFPVLLDERPGQIFVYGLPEKNVLRFNLKRNLCGTSISA